VPTYIVLIGPPGVGKGTQAKIVAEKIGLVHISSGDIFRENIKNKTKMGLLAQSYITKGELVPDRVTITMIQDRLKQVDCANGALLDGFPRTPTQAEELDEFLSKFNTKVNFVPCITASDEVLIDRLSGRVSCRAQGHVFHLKNNPPKIDGICDFDGSDLYVRDDDKVETVKHRIEVYTRQTSVLIDHYRKLGNLVEIDGAKPIEDVTRDLLTALGYQH